MSTAFSRLAPPLRAFPSKLYPLAFTISKRHLRSLPDLRYLPNDALLQILDEAHLPFSTLQSLHPLLRHRRIASDPRTAIKLMRAYAACGHPECARDLFDETPHKNIIFYNVMIRSYVNNHLYDEALALFSQMGTSYGVTPDNYTFPCALKACSDSANLVGGSQIHGSVTKLGLSSNLFVGNALITMYFKCNRYRDAFDVFNGMPHRDVVSWNAMIAGYAQSGLFERALDVCSEMASLNRPKPDAGTMASILPAVLSTDAGNIRFVRGMFDGMSNRGLVSWNAMIAIYANNDMAAEAVQLFSQMKVDRVEPDVVTFSSVLPACGDLSALVLGNQIHECIKRRQLLPNLVLENALMDMYANCGCLEAARDVFDGMKGRDVVSWTAIISAYGIHGHGREAINLFRQMEETGLKPDSIAFVSILAACSYAGLLAEGKHYFSSMADQYQVVPRLEHFACMVDLLGRAGCLEEAYGFISRMPIEPNVRVWGALLGACRVYSNMSIGLVAADHLFRLAPQESGYYVLMSNIYAKAGRWEDVMSVRRIMTSKGVKKVPGHSNVELGNKIHTFHIGDWSHPQSNEIYKELDLLKVRMKELGYVAETNSALHDVEEEDKEGHLLEHCEKLAIAFMLINTGPGMPVRITMNLRMCGDCHHAAKLISSIRKREIIIRDTNRFHHFENGSCSCRDYW